MRRLTLALTLLLSGCFFGPKVGYDESLVIAACPDLILPTDDSFGATTVAAGKNGQIYYKCRCAGAPSTCPKE
jgi:hypothetical protein